MKNIKEKIIEGIAIGIGISISIVVLGLAYRFIWEIGKSIWSALQK
jgi:hypothetical protein